MSFVPNEHVEILDKIKLAKTSRKEILAKRLELMKKGDRKGAKELLKQANQSEMKPLTESGVMLVKDDGTVEKFSRQKHLKQTFKKAQQKEKKSGRMSEAEFIN